MDIAAPVCEANNPALAIIMSGILLTVVVICVATVICAKINR